MTRVAVVIPCFNDGPTLRSTVESALAQQERPELVVVDDGSNDPDTLRVLEDLERDRVAVVRRENGGLAAARMTGVEATTAPYVYPLDADDLLEPDALGPLADALDRDVRAAVAWGELRVFGEFEASLRTARVFDPWRLTFISEIPGTSLVRRAALEATGGWTFRGGYEDWDLWLTLAEAGWTGVHVDVPMLAYRRHGRRMLGDCVPQHVELVAAIRGRHETMFAARGEARRQSPSPRRVKWGFALVTALPFLTPFTRHRLYLLISQPRQILLLRRLRRRAAAGRPLAA